MTVSKEEKLDEIRILENVNKLLTYGVMLDLLIVVYVQFVILLTYGVMLDLLIVVYVQFVIRGVAEK
jgi:hypothetical protein